MDWLKELLGTHAEELEPHQMAARAVVMFAVSLVLIRISSLRLLGKQTAFDHLTVLMLGAMLGRAIVVAQSMTGSILAASVIILLHRVSAWVTFKSRFAGSLIKGRALQLIKDQEYVDQNLSKAHITKNDIEEALRTELNSTDISKIKEAWLERSGKISIIEK
jgi:uncharacterized membrane protein YcaP (DUF421 family)